MKNTSKIRLLRVAALSLFMFAGFNILLVLKMPPAPEVVVAIVAAGLGFYLGCRAADLEKKEMNSKKEQTP